MDTRLDIAAAQAELTADRSSLGGKYLTFRLGNEEFGAEILKIREIIGMMSITAIPRMPDYVKGVINLRGKVIPVVDLRLKFGLPEVAHTEQTCTVVVDVGTEIGIIVDTVSEVLDISAENIDPPPQFNAKLDTSFILGMGKVGDAVKILLNIDQIFADELQMMSDLQRHAEGDDAIDS